jgi:phenylacetate-CoA ligase
VHRAVALNVSLPLLYRRTWPRLRHELALLEQSETLTPDATRRLWERRAIDAARAAGVHTPFFRRRYRGHGAIDTIEEFRRLPVVPKETLREHVEEMLRDGADRRALQRGATGGSTGMPTPYYHDDAWWCRASAVALRGDAWAGWRIGEPHALLWGTPLAETRSARWRRVLGERARNQLFLPSFDLSDANVDRNVDRLRRGRPRLVTGYASVLVAYARRILEREVAIEPPRAVVSSAETLRPEMRDVVHRAFNAPVFDRYGCRELGMIAQECGVHAGLHIATEHVYVEVDVDGRPARPGETGRLLVTLLGEPTFPFVRYEVGDAAVQGDGEPCLCGLPSPRLARIEGRLLDVLRRADGGSLSGTFFPHLLKEFPFVREFQVEQDETGAVEIRVVAEGPRPSDAAVAPIVDATRGALGDVPVRVTFVAALERTAAGKVRMTQSRWKGPARAGAGSPA